MVVGLAAVVVWCAGFCGWWFGLLVVWVWCLCFGWFGGLYLLGGFGCLVLFALILVYLMWFRVLDDFRGFGCMLL